MVCESSTDIDTILIRAKGQGRVSNVTYAFGVATATTNSVFRFGQPIVTLVVSKPRHVGRPLLVSQKTWQPPILQAPRMGKRDSLGGEKRGRITSRGKCKRDARVATPNTPFTTTANNKRARAGPYVVTVCDAHMMDDWPKARPGQRKRAYWHTQPLRGHHHYYHHHRRHRRCKAHFIPGLFSAGNHSAPLRWPARHVAVARWLARPTFFLLMVWSARCRGVCVFVVGSSRVEDARSSHATQQHQPSNNYLKKVCHVPARM